MFHLRVLTLIIGLPLMLLVCYAGGWWLLAATIILAIIALREWSRAVELTQVRLDYLLSSFFILIFIYSAHAIEGVELDSYTLFLVALVVALAFISRVMGRGGKSALADIGTTVLTPLYLGLFFSYVIRLRQGIWPAESITMWGIAVEPGVYFLVLLFLVCWIMDTGAYLCGRFIGGAKLCPAISPGKTIAGFIGAVVWAALAMLGGFALLGLPLVLGFFAGALMGVVGQMGDLGKSLIKREVGVKDFGLVFPGHGGVLDRFDNVLFNGPFLYYFLIWMFG